MNFHKNASKQQKDSLAECGSIFGEKKFLLIFIPFYWFDQKSCLNKSKFSSGFLPFKHGKKKKFLSISVLVSEIDTFLTKKEVQYKFPQKCSKTTQRPCLSVCGSLCEEKLFLLIFISFYWFDQNIFFF